MRGAVNSHMGVQPHRIVGMSVKRKDHLKNEDIRGYLWILGMDFVVIGVGC
jgi:hypothetical protein